MPQVNEFSWFLTFLFILVFLLLYIFDFGSFLILKYNIKKMKNIFSFKFFI